MNLIDIAVLSILGISILISLFRGFIREVLSLVGLALASAITLMSKDAVSAYLLEQGMSKIVAYGVATGGIFILLCIVFAVINSYIVRLIRASDFSALDRSLGILFGFARGAFLVSLCFMIVAMVYKENDFPVILKEAKTLGGMKFGADILKSMAPETAEKLEAETKKQIKDAQEKAQDETDNIKDDMNQNMYLMRNQLENDRNKLERDFDKLKDGNK